MSELYQSRRQARLGVTGPISSTGLAVKRWFWAGQMVIRLASKRKYRALGKVIITPVEATGASLPWIVGVDYQGWFVGGNR